MCDHLQAVTEGEIRRLLINVPPGHAKSLIVAVLWPAWSWVVRPEWRSIFSSYSADLATRDSVRCRSVIDAPWYQANFARPYDKQDGWRLRDDLNTKDDFYNTRSGFRKSLSVGSKATGFRGNCVIVDDPLNAKDAPSKLKRDTAIYWWDKVMSSRLSNPREGSRVIIMQRLHEEDLSGHVLKAAEGGGIPYEHLRLPSEFEPKDRCITFATDPKTRVRREFYRDPRTEPDELLFPDLFDREVIAQAKADLRTDYAGQHQQRPAPAEGLMFKKAWWRFWKPDGVEQSGSFERPEGCSQYPARAIPPKMDRVIISLDASFKDKPKSDFVVFLVIGIKKADRFVLEVSRARRDFVSTCEEFKRLCKKWPQARTKLVEDKANGTAVINKFRSTIAGIVEIEPQGGKEARASALQPEVQGGNWFLEEGAAWVPDWIVEFSNFPNGKNDDQVDAASQGAVFLSGSPAIASAVGMSNY